MGDRHRTSFIYHRDGRRCRYCERPLQRNQATVDHYVPKTAGGSNEAANLRLACHGCNYRKGNMDPESWEILIRIPGFLRVVVRDARPSRIELLARCAPLYRERPCPTFQDTRAGQSA
jgi:hypothetical protein